MKLTVFEAAFVVWFLALSAANGNGNGLGSKLENRHDDKGHGHDLGLSDEIVPYQELGQRVTARDELITEKIEDALFASNRERRRLLKERATDDVDTEIPDRKTIFGKGDRFLSPGPTSDGFEIGTGATWRPYWLVWGQVRSAFQVSRSGPRPATMAEWANRLDVLADWYLTATERVHIAFRPLDREGGFTGYTFKGEDEGWNENFNLQPRSLFFEGEFGEIFPRLDQNDRLSLDYGFSVGRQPISLQEGVMINDVLDGVGIARNNLFLFGSSSTRLSAFWAPGQVHRGDNVRDRKAQLFALFTQHDFQKTTIELDGAYVAGGEHAGDGAYLGLAHIRRFGYWNSTLRANGSWALDEESAAISDGYLLTHELSRTMPYNEDIVYFNVFYGIGNYTSAARDPSAGGPLGRMGLLYEAVGLGTLGAALGQDPGESVGFSLGYQHFIFGEDADQQLIVELGGQSPTSSDSNRAGEIGLGARYQRALNQHAIFVLDGYVTQDEAGESGYGARSEIRLKY
ncbi:MAG: hypothetical protein ACI8UO_001360 [Verrucomicrobiales bacterium]|jgi:hypothetical protein